MWLQVALRTAWAPFLGEGEAAEGARLLLQCNVKSPPLGLRPELGAISMRSPR